MFLLNKQLVGLDISDNSVEVVLATSSSSKADIRSMARAKLKPGIVVKGELKDGPALAKILKALFAKAQPEPIEPKDIVFLIPDAKSFVHVAMINKTHTIEREDLVLKEIHNNIPIEPSNLLYEYKIIESSKEKEKVLIIAAHKDYLKKWQSFFTKNGIGIKIFDLEMLAVFRGVYQTIPNSPICLCDLGAHSINLSIYTKSGPFYTHTIDSGGDVITTAIAYSLKITKEQAEQKKITADLAKLDDSITSIIVKVLDPIYTEIDILLRYINEKYQINVSEVVLIGGTAKLKGLAEFLSSKLNRPVKMAESAYLADGRKLEYIGAIGAAIKGKMAFDTDLMFLPLEADAISSEITLAPSAARGKTQVRGKIMRDIGQEDKLPSGKTRKYLILLFAMVIAGGALVAGYYWWRSHYSYRANENLQEQVDALDNTPEVSEPAQDIKTTPEADIEAPEPETEVITAIVTDQGITFLNVREGPGTNFDIIVKVYPGESYPVLQEDEFWAKIELTNGIPGWVFKEYIIINK